MNKLSTEDKANIFLMYKNGSTPKEIGEKYGIYNNSVTRLLRNNGIERTQLIRISEEETKYIISEYTAGVSSEIIAAKVKRDAATVCRVLKRNHIVIRPGSENKRIYQIREDFFENIDCEEKAYFLGFLYADGNLSKRGNCIKLTLIDRDILETFSKIIYGFEKVSEEKVIDKITNITRTYYTVNIYCQKMHADLTKLGCGPNKCFTITFPKNLMDDSLLRHFIRGVFDGDGCLSLGKSGKNVIDFTSNLQFLTGLREYLLDKIGIEFQKYEQRHKDRDTSTRNMQVANTETVSKLLDYMYSGATIYLPRKFAKMNEYFKSLETKGKKIHLKFNQPNNYGTSFIPTINDTKLDTKTIERLTDDEKNKLVQPIFEFYRSNGFPYPIINDDDLVKEFYNLKFLDSTSIEKDNKLSIFNYAGTSIMKHFSPHFYEVTSGTSSKLSMLESFNDDESLKSTIANRLQRNHMIHGNMIKQGLRNSRIAFMPSIFNTSVAKFLYEKYTKPDSIIYDYSMGFGQRLLASLALPHHVTYIGVDPMEKSVTSNRNIYDFYKKNIPTFNTTVDIIQGGSESFRYDKYIGKVDFAFSSPPYLNIEVYENNEAQAYHRGYTHFINDWWTKTAINLSMLVKENGILALNMKEIAIKLPIAADMCAILEKYGFTQIGRHDLLLTRNQVFNNKSGQNKFEPIFIFQKQSTKVPQ